MEMWMVKFRKNEIFSKKVILALFGLIIQELEGDLMLNDV